MTHQFDSTVLREYDIRGIIGETLGPDDARAIGRPARIPVVELAVAKGQLALVRAVPVHHPDAPPAVVVSPAKRYLPAIGRPARIVVVFFAGQLDILRLLGFEPKLLVLGPGKICPGTDQGDKGDR